MWFKKLMLSKKLKYYRSKQKNYMHRWSVKHSSWQSLFGCRTSTELYLFINRKCSKEEPWKCLVGNPTNFGHRYISNASGKLKCANGRNRKRSLLWYLELCMKWMGKSTKLYIYHWRSLRRSRRCKANLELTICYKKRILIFKFST